MTDQHRTGPDDDWIMRPNLWFSFTWQHRAAWVSWLKVGFVAEHAIASHHPLIR